MKTLTETLNKMLGNTLRIEIAKMKNNDQGEPQTLESKLQKISEQFEYDRYLQILKTGLFEGTYHEYKERIKLGPIGYAQIF